MQLYKDLGNKKTAIVWNLFSWIECFVGSQKLIFHDNSTKFEEEPPLNDVLLETNSDFDSSCIFTSLPQVWLLTYLICEHADT